MFLVALGCLFVGEQRYSKSYERISMKVYLGSGVVQWRTDYILVVILR